MNWVFSKQTLHITYTIYTHITKDCVLFFLFSYHNNNENKEEKFNIFFLSNFALSLSLIDSFVHFSVYLWQLTSMKWTTIGREVAECFTVSISYVLFVVAVVQTIHLCNDWTIWWIKIENLFPLHMLEMIFILLLFFSVYLYFVFYSSIFWCDSFILSVNDMNLWIELLWKPSGWKFVLFE